MNRLISISMSVFWMSFLFSQTSFAAPVSFATNVASRPKMIGPVSGADERLTLSKVGVSLSAVSATPSPSQPRLSVAVPGADNQENSAAVSLPPAPSSLALVISGLLTIGAYHGTRALPRLHLGHVPDWYHADATQIGHVTPVNPNDLVGAAVLDLCFAIPPLSVNPFELTTFEHDVILVPDVIPTRAPRSPPTADLCA